MPTLQEEKFACEWQAKFKGRASICPWPTVSYCNERQHLPSPYLDWLTLCSLILIVDCLVTSFSRWGWQCKGKSHSDQNPIRGCLSFFTPKASILHITGKGCQYLSPLLSRGQPKKKPVHLRPNSQDVTVFCISTRLFCRFNKRQSL